jgi:hypothetical protein
MVIALYADHTYYQAIKDGHCSESTPHICDVPGYGDTGTARTLGNVATAVGAVGIIAAGVGAYLWLFAPKDHLESRDVAIVPSVDNQSAGLSAIGRF